MMRSAIELKAVEQSPCPQIDRTYTLRPPSLRSNRPIKLRLEIVFERPPVIENTVPSTYHGYWFFSFTVPCSHVKYRRPNT
jgi:hypothetical protein